MVWNTHALTGIPLSLFCVAAFVLSLGAEAAESESTDNLLALTWQPAFCEYRPTKPECITLNRGGLPRAGTQLSLHGLWPQPRGNDYCGVMRIHLDADKSGRWADLPEPALSETTAQTLQDAMPGTRSYLDRHEWIKHGSCYFASGGAEEYFADALHLTQAVNQSSVGDFLKRHIGKEVETRLIRDQFDHAFGSGTGQRVSFACRKDGARILIQEVRIGLSGTIRPDIPVTDLIRAAAPVSIGCRIGFIDPVGLQ